MAIKFNITSFKTIVGATPAALDAAILPQIQAGGILFGTPFVATAGICQVVLTKVLDNSPDQIDAIAAQAVADALQAGTVVPAFDQKAADAQAVAEAIAAGTVVPAPKP